MNIAGRFATTFVGAFLSGVALSVALVFSFVFGPVGLATGLACLVGAPFLTMRLTSPFTEGGAGLSKQAVCLAAWGALGIATGAAALLGIPVRRGDAFDTAWLILAYTAVCVGALGHGYTSPSGRETRILLWGHYRIVYLKRSQEEVHVVGVFHGAMDLDQ